MSEPDLTLVLRDIRDEIRGTNTRLDTTRVELKAEISAVRTELKAEISAVRTELKAELVVVGETLKDLAAHQLILTRYVKNVADRHDTSIEDLRERVDRLEATR